MRWGMIPRVLANTVATVRARGMVYKAVDQSLLLYDREILVVKWGNAKGPGGVPPPGVQADHGDDDKKWGGQGVGIPPVVAALEAAGQHPIM